MHPVKILDALANVYAILKESQFSGCHKITPLNHTLGVSETFFFYSVNIQLSVFFFPLFPPYNIVGLIIVTA